MPASIWADPLSTYFHCADSAADSFDHEDGVGQFEIDWRFSECLNAADRLVFLRWMSGEVARRHGGFASWMPKPRGDARISNVGKYQSCMVSKLRIIWKQVTWRAPAAISICLSEVLPTPPCRTCSSSSRASTMSTYRRRLLSPFIHPPLFFF